MTALTGYCNFCNTFLKLQCSFLQSCIPDAGYKQAAKVHELYWLSKKLKIKFVVNVRSRDLKLQQFSCI